MLAMVVMPDKTWACHESFRSRPSEQKRNDDRGEDQEGGDREDLQRGDHHS
jgi:hypothetical protein